RARGTGKRASTARRSARGSCGATSRPSDVALRRRFSERPLRLPRLRPYVPAPDAPAVYWFNGERDDIIREVVSRVAHKHDADPRAVELTLNDAALHEVRRLTSQHDEETRESLGFWKGISRGIA